MRINDTVFGKPVSKEVKAEFKKLEGGGLTGTLDDILSERKPTYKKYLGDRTPFVRMWTAINISGSTKNDTFYYVINENNQQSYDSNEQIFGSKKRNQLSSRSSNQNKFDKPAAGITSVSSKTGGATGLTKITTVEFMVHSKDDFQTIFLPFFLRPGATVCVDYGWSDSKGEQLYSIDKLLDNNDTEMSTFYSKVFGSGELEEELGWLNKEKNFGIVDTLIGQVTDYNSTVTPEGSFQCSLQFTSQNTAVLDAEITDENNLKFIFSGLIESILVAGLSGMKEAAFVDSLSDLSLLSPGDRQSLANQYFDNVMNYKALGDIPPNSKKIGVFYQDVTDATNVSYGGEILYISYGLFEDLFLNNLIIRRKTGEPYKKYEMGFNNQDSYVRWEDNLYRRQKADLMSNESLPLFLYPDSWNNNETYNKIKPFDHKSGNHDNTKDDKKKHRIPLRELFISVPLISNAFSKKHNVNDALEDIFDSINDDSYDIFKIKMVANNRARTSVSFQDINLFPPDSFKKINEDYDFLIFDVTSEHSIVSNCDLRFMMPKSNLSSMVAIKSMGGEDQIFDISSLDRFNLLFLLDKEFNKDLDDFNKVKIKHLPAPINNEPPSFIKSYDFAKIVPMISDNIPNDASFIDENNSYITGLNEKLAEIYKLEAEESGQEIKNPDLQKNKPNKKHLIATSFRDKHGKQAKLDSFYTSNENSVAPLLGLELVLTVYGNTYLDIGHCINVNYLPEPYKNRCYFQILGIDNKLDENGWQTTYQTAFRPIPQEKKRIIDTSGYEVKFDAQFHTDIGNRNNQDNSGWNTNDLDHNLIEFDGPFEVIKRIGKDRNDNTRDYKHEIGKDSNPNIISMTFGTPRTIEDIAFIYAYSNVLFEESDAHHVDYNVATTMGNQVNAGDWGTNPISKFNGRLNQFRILYQSSNAFMGGLKSFFNPSLSGKLSVAVNQSESVFYLTALEFVMMRKLLGTSLSQSIFKSMAVLPAGPPEKLAPMIFQTILSRLDDNAKDVPYYECTLNGESALFSKVQTTRCIKISSKLSRAMHNQANLIGFLEKLVDRYKGYMEDLRELQVPQIENVSKTKKQREERKIIRGDYF